MRRKGTDKYSFISYNRTKGFYEYDVIDNLHIQSNILGTLDVRQLRKLDWINSEIKRIANYYLNELKGIDGLNFLRIPEYTEPNWHIFGVLVNPEDKYWIMDAIRAEGIMCNVHYIPLHRNKFYRGLSSDEEMPGAVEFYNKLLRLPIYPSLTAKERKIIVDGVKKVFNYD